VQCAVYVQNRCPHAKLNGQTPHEAWSGKKPCVSHLKVFGSVAYAHVSAQQRTKLEDMSKKLVFIGYDEKTKGYKLFNPVTNKVLVSRDVVIDEENEWNNSAMTVKSIATTSGSSETTFGSPTSERRNLDNVPARQQKVSDEEEEPLQPRTRSLQDIYNTNNEVHVVCLLAESEDVRFEEAVVDEKWKKAMDEEIVAIERNNTWELSELPQGARPIGVKWVFKKKMNAQGEIERYKARLVAKGYRQREGVDYVEVFAPVTRMETVRLLISIATQNKWPIFQMDVKSAFLNGVLKEEVYIEQPLGYMRRGEEKKVLRLKKALYGLKQAPRAWNDRIHTYFVENKYEQCPVEHALYIKKHGGRIMFIALYVDDLVFMGNDAELIKKFKRTMEKEFEMTDLGHMRYFLGLEVKQLETDIFVSQERYAEDILSKFKMARCSPVSTPMEPGTKLSKFDGGDHVDANKYRSLVGSLRYLTSTRPDLLLSVGIVSRYMEEPTYTHWRALKRILRYVRGTTSLGLYYTRSDDYRLVGYSDSDWCGDVDDRRSTSGYVFFMSNTAFTWLSKKQPIVTLSTCEAEYVAASLSVCHAIWLRNLLSKLEMKQKGGTVIRVDNKSAIELAKNSVNHGRNKHIDVKFHSIRE